MSKLKSMRTELTPEEAKNLVHELDYIHNIRSCDVIIQRSPHGQKACYYANTIWITPPIQVWEIFHEYAHHLAYYLEIFKREYSYWETRKQLMRKWNFGYEIPAKRKVIHRKRKRHHGTLFIRCLKHLLKIAPSLGYDSSTYPLEREYRKVAKRIQFLTTSVEVKQ
jgi:hypothetical protein